MRRRTDAKVRRPVNLLLDERTIKYLSSWKSRSGAEVGMSEVIEELVSYAEEGEMEREILEPRGEAEST